MTTSTTSTILTDVGDLSTHDHLTLHGHAARWVSRLTDRNGSTFYVGRSGTLVRDLQDAEVELVRESAEMFAQPSWNGLPASRIAALDIRGEAVAVTLLAE